MTKGQTHSVYSCLVVYAPVHLQKNSVYSHIYVEYAAGLSIPPMIIYIYTVVFLSQKG